MTRGFWYDSELKKYTISQCFGRHSSLRQKRMYEQVQAMVIFF